MITGVEHVAGEHSGTCDDLSRRDTTGSFRTVEQVVPGVTDFRVPDDWRVREAIRLCDPQSKIPFEEFWGSIGRVVESARRAGRQ